MSVTPLHDLKSNLGGGQVFKNGDEFADAGGDLNGAWIDCRYLTDAKLEALVNLVITGTPTSMSLTIQAEEADDSSGTNKQFVADTNGKAVVTDTTSGKDIWLKFFFTKPFVRLIIDDSASSFTGGSSPKAKPAGRIMGPKTDSRR